MAISQATDISYWFLYGWCLSGK